MKVYQTKEVFGISRNVPLNYVERDDVDGRLRDSLDRKKHITIFGSSKQGKTCLRKHCIPESDIILIQCNNRWSLAELNSNILKRAGFEIAQSTKVSSTGKNKIIASIKAKLFGTLETSLNGESEYSDGIEETYSALELDIEDANDVISALNSISFDKYIVLEDFHYLKPETQRDFSIELKAFHENSDLSFIIVGVWIDENRLIIYNGDLTGRLISINADLWLDSELRKVIERGEKLLNIRFTDTFKENLISDCYESVYLVQEACYKVCEKNGIYETQEECIEIGSDVDTKEIVSEIVKIQSGRYNSFLNLYSEGFQETLLQMHKWIWYPIISFPIEKLKKGIGYREIRESIQLKHEKGSGLNPGNLTQALKSVSSLQIKKSIMPIIIDYDESNLKLHIVDKGFLIWLEYQDKDALLSMAGF